MNKIQLAIEAKKKFENWNLLLNLYLKRIKDDYAILETKNDLKIKIRVNSTDLMQLGTVWLADDYKIKGFEIKDSDVIVDIGAHIGLFGLYSSQFCTKGKIYCFEPILENYKILKENIELNGLKNIFSINLAISDKKGKKNMYVNADESAHSFFPSGDTVVEINSTTIESFFNEKQITKCDFLKMDCEGAEYEIINTMTEESFSKIKKIVIEYHFADSNPKLFDNLIKKLESMGFELEMKKMSNSMGMIYALK